MLVTHGFLLAAAILLAEALGGPIPGKGPKRPALVTRVLPVPVAGIPIVPRVGPLLPAAAVGSLVSAGIAPVAGPLLSPVAGLNTAAPIMPVPVPVPVGSALGSPVGVPTTGLPAASALVANTIPALTAAQQLQLMASQPLVSPLATGGVAVPAAPFFGAPATFI